jgi:hypothetical protein
MAYDYPSVGQPMSEQEMREMELKWQAQRDLETLIEAAKIKKDPERKERAMACLKEKRAELANIKV